MLENNQEIEILQNRTPMVTRSPSAYSNRRAGLSSVLLFYHFSVKHVCLQISSHGCFRNKGHFHQPPSSVEVEATDGKMETHTYRFHVNGERNAKTLLCPLFSHQIFFPPLGQVVLSSPFLPSSSFLSFSFILFFVILLMYPSLSPGYLVTGHDLPNYLLYQFDPWLRVVSLQIPIASPTSRGLPDVLTIYNVFSMGK